MDQRTQFIADYLRDSLSVSELCELYGVSRKTGYKWIDRYVQQGPAGLAGAIAPAAWQPECDARAHCGGVRRGAHPSPELGCEEAAVDPRAAAPALGSARPHRPCARSSAAAAWCPRSASVARSAILAQPMQPDASLPNDVWSADYKGQFKTGDGLYCFPLTVTDNCRFLLGCQALYLSRGQRVRSLRLGTLSITVRCNRLVMEFQCA